LNTKQKEQKKHIVLDSAAAVATHVQPQHLDKGKKGKHWLEQNACTVTKLLFFIKRLEFYYRATEDQTFAMRKYFGPFANKTR
jgi:hypothetical protein